MRANRIIAAISLLLPAMFLGCGPNAPNTGGAVTSASQGTQSEGVVRQTPTTQSSATPAPAQTLPSGNAVIATRLGTGGLEVDLMRAGVTGDLFAVELRCRNGSKVEHRDIQFPIEQVSVVDDATSRRYSVLKDQTGQYMAAPMIDWKGDPIQSIYLRVAPENDGIIWFKFPAPPPQAQTVSINIPKIAPFDNIRIQR